MPEPALTRRECLTRGAGAVLAAGAAAVGGYLLYDPRGPTGAPPASTTPPLPDFTAGVDFDASSPRLSIATAGVETANLNTAPVSEPPRPAAQRIHQLVRGAIDGLIPGAKNGAGIRRFIRAGDIVLLKPNVGFDRPPQLGATTHPEIIRAVVRLCREAGAAEVLIADNPIEAPDACFARSGLARVAADEDARIVVPTDHDFRAAPPDPRSQGRDLRTRGADQDTGAGLPAAWPILYAPLARATKLIGLAPIKDHNLASASIVLKNWYGLLGGRRNQLHQAIQAVIADLAVLFRPTLVIADGTRVMLRNGPTGGRASDVRPGGVLGRPAVVAAVDPIACDAWCYENLLGRDPAKLTYLALAHERVTAPSSATRVYGESDWHTYERQGLIARAAL